jgi:hypothetical protein
MMRIGDAFKLKYMAPSNFYCEYIMDLKSKELKKFSFDFLDCKIVDIVELISKKNNKTLEKYYVVELFKDSIHDVVETGDVYFSFKHQIKMYDYQLKRILKDNK